MKIVVPMSEICDRSLSDLIHYLISSLLIADRHSDNRRNNMSLICSAVIQYLQQSDFVSLGCELQCGIWRDRQSAIN